MAYDFAASLAIEDRYADVADAALRHFFPTATIHRNASGATEAQFNGEDYKLVLPSGKVLTVDVKADTHQPKNLVLEFWNIHLDGRQPTKGWALKDTTNDYILYQFVHHGVSYLLDKQRLLVMANRHQDEWRAKFRAIECANLTFTTKSLLIPLTQINTYFGTSSLYEESAS